MCITIYYGVRETIFWFEIASDSNILINNGRTDVLNNRQRFVYQTQTLLLRVR